MSAHSTESLHSWLAARIAAYVQRSPEEIKPEVPLTEYGLDSVYALTLVGDIEDYLGLSLDPTVMWDHPTIAALTHNLLQSLAHV